MHDRRVTSWNRYPLVDHAAFIDISDRTGKLPETPATMLPFGNGRSYGDVCLNGDGVLLGTRRLDKFISFDVTTGILACESGVLLDDILQVAIPSGWFLAVTPGTRFVTVGGAIANDVHGKNHHVQGTFGHHLRCFELLRSNGDRRICVPGANDGWFEATVGGLGLTGLITWAELQLMPIANAYLETESVRFPSLRDFWELNRAAEARWPYTVAWIDCGTSGPSMGRGILIQGRHAADGTEAGEWRERQLRVPIVPPVSLINPLTLRIFNAAYYHRPAIGGVVLSHYVPYFYPLDAVLDWNRIYGRRGFFQYQCVLPPDSCESGIDALLRRISHAGSGSFLAVLKTFGKCQSLGMLSFPRPGATLALDFPNHGEATHKLFRELDAVVRDAGGALYPAKDARMPAEMFRHSFPRWREFSTYIDPHFSSGFWRRVVSEA